MSRNDHVTLDQVLEGSHVLELTPPMIKALTCRVEEALISYAQEDMTKLSTQLVDLATAQWKNSNPEVRLVIRLNRTLVNVQVDSPILQAFQLGQLFFAQGLVSQAANTRADEMFVDRLFEERYVRYVEALSEKDQSIDDLAALTGESVDVVRRKMNELTARGASDYRGEVGKVLYFLTPAAHAVFAKKKS